MIQHYFNKQALEMLPTTYSYIQSSNRSSHHSSVILNKICNSYKPLLQMSDKELNEFDCQCLSYLHELDNSHIN